MRTIQERGFEGLRIRDVAAAAGVSTATVHYYFDDLDGLLTEIHSLAAEHFISDRMAAVARHGDARDKIVEMIRAGLPESPDDPMTVALYHVDNAKRTDPVRALLGTRLYDRQVMLYFGVLELGVGQGHFTMAAPVLEVAQNLVGLEDAYCMHIIERNTSLPLQRCIDLMISYARLATGCPEIGVE